MEGSYVLWGFWHGVDILDFDCWKEIGNCEDG